MCHIEGKRNSKSRSWLKPLALGEDADSGRVHVLGNASYSSREVQLELVHTWKRRLDWGWRQLLLIHSLGPSFIISHDCVEQREQTLLLRNRIKPCFLWQLGCRMSGIILTPLQKGAQGTKGSSTNPVGKWTHTGHKSNGLPKNNDPRSRGRDERWGTEDFCGHERTVWYYNDGCVHYTFV